MAEKLFITRFDFFHLRSVNGLIRKTSRNLRRLKYKNFDQKLHDEMEKLELYIKHYNKKKVIETLKSTLELIKEKDKYLYLIDSNELKILYNELKKEAHDKEVDLQIQDLLSSIASEKPELYKEFMESVDRPFKEVQNLILDRIAKIRKILFFLRSGRKERVAINNLISSMRSEKGVEWSMLRHLRFQRRHIRQGRVAIKNIDSSLKKIRADIKSKNYDRASKDLKNLITEEQKLFNSLVEDVKLIADLIYKDTVIYVELVDILVNKIPNYIELLKKQNFPEDDLKVLNELVEYNINRVMEHVSEVYGMSQYVDDFAKKLAA